MLLFHLDVLQKTPDIVRHLSLAEPRDKGTAAISIVHAQLLSRQRI